MKLVRQPVAGIAGAVAQRTAALNHEVLDDPVKNQSVKVRFAIGVGRERLLILAVKLRALGQADKVGDDERHFLVLELGQHCAVARRDPGVDSVFHHAGRRVDFHAEKIGRGGEDALLFPPDRRLGGDHLAKRLPLLEVGGALNEQYRAGVGVADRERNRLAGGIAGNRRDVDRHNRLSALAKLSRAGQTKRQHGERSVKSLHHNPRPGSVTAARLHGHLFSRPHLGWDGCPSRPHFGQF